MMFTSRTSYSGGSRGGWRGRLPLLKKRKKEKKRDRERRGGEGGGQSSVPLLSISAFIHLPVKCNKSLYIFTRCPFSLSNYF